MKTSVSNLETDLKTTKRTGDPSDRYLDIMETFHKEAQSQYETLEFMFKKMSDTYKDVADYFAFDSSKYLIGEFFTDLKTFANQFQQCMEENRKARETEEKIRRAEEERAAREKEREARKNQKERLMTGGASGTKGAGMGASGPTGHGDLADTGVMDNLLDTLFKIYNSYSRFLFSYFQSLEALQSGRLFEGGSPGGPPGGRGRRPIRRDHNLMGLLTHTN